LFEGWAEHPPTNLLLQAIIDGLGGGSKAKPAKPSAEQTEAESRAMAAMQQSALAEIQTKAGPSFPVMRGKDKGLPKAAPVFDENLLRERNAALAAGLKLKVVER
jgi:hypothetical protein